MHATGANAAFFLALTKECEAPRATSKMSDYAFQANLAYVLPVHKASMRGKLLAGCLRPITGLKRVACSVPRLLSHPVSLVMQGLVPFFREQVRLLGGFQVA